MTSDFHFEIFLVFARNELVEDGNTRKWHRGDSSQYPMPITILVVVVIDCRSECHRAVSAKHKRAQRFLFLDASRIVIEWFNHTFALQATTDALTTARARIMNPRWRLHYSSEL